MILLMYVYLMMLLFFFTLILFLYFFIMKKLIILDWVIYFYNSMEFSFLLYIDYMSLLFMSFVSLISMLVLLYSIDYMEGDKFINRFSMLVLLFVISMFLMILSPSILSILLGWDGLGLISYCLVIYYQNDNAYKSGMLTIFSNRIGDVAILMLIGFSMMFGSWYLVLYNFNFFMIILLILISFTKSAQIPFSLWLPAAMMAPTPVSSLVHSSTLVTAGVYLMIRYYEFLFYMNMNNYVFFFSSFTMFMAGLIANFEFDFKKIIALSTLSQLSFMMMILSLGAVELSFFHLLIHALFKSLMFMCVGSYIHYFNNCQDIRKFGGVIYLYPFKSMVLMFSLFCLMGMPFLSGFYSKDLIMEFIMNFQLNFISFILLSLSMIFTISYSVRLILFIILSGKNYELILFKKESLLMNVCMMFMIFMIVLMSYIMLKLMNWNNIIVLSKYQKFFLLKLIFYGSFLGIYFYVNSLNKYNYMCYFLSNMFMLSMIYKIYDLPLNLIKLYENIFDKNMLEFKMKMLEIKLVMFMYKIKQFNLMEFICLNLFFLFMIFLIMN